MSANEWRPIGPQTQTRTIASADLVATAVASGIGAVVRIEAGLSPEDNRRMAAAMMSAGTRIAEALKADRPIPYTLAAPAAE